MDLRKVTDPLNRGMVGGLLGIPAEIAAMVTNGGRSIGNLANRLAGVNAPPAPMIENPQFGQEWWGNKMQQAGYVTPNRNALAEFGAGLLDPGSVMAHGPALAKGLFGLGDPAATKMLGGLLGATAWRGPNKRNDMNASYLKDLISSQRFLDRSIVAQKIRDQIFDVHVTPSFSLDGRDVRAITDGHHALEAAIKSGNTPNFIQQTARENDRIGMLNNGSIDDYLQAAYHDSPWYDFATKIDLF